MDIILKTNYNNVEISLSGDDNELDNIVKNLNVITDRLARNTSAINGQSEYSGEPYKNNISGFNAFKNKYKTLVELDKDGPKVRPDTLDLLYKSKPVRSIKVKQAGAFVTISYVLMHAYDEKDVSVKRVTKLMKKSGIDCSNLQNLTPYLSKKLLYILKPAGSQYFTLTKSGEDMARDLLDNAAGMAMNGN